MRVREFEAALGSLTPWSASEIDQRTRRLRELRMLPTGGRGLNAPDLSPEHAATILIAMSAAAKATDTNHAVATYATMRPVASEHGFDFLGCQSFAEVLELILSSPETAARIARIVVYRSWPQADLIWLGADGAENVQSYRSDNAPQTGFGFGMYEAVTLTASFLSQLALDLSHTDADLDSQGGWVADRGAE